jgi:hypothetical protein
MGRTAREQENETAEIADAYANGRELVTEGGVHVFGPAGEVHDVPVVRPVDPGSHDAPTLRRLQDEGVATRPRDTLLDVAVKRSASASTMSDALAHLRRD